jgi:hypothetical protein
MSMTQLVFGTALGFLAVQALLYCLKQLFSRIAGIAERSRVRSREALPVSVLISGFVRYAPSIAVSAALITLGVWAVKDHLAARRAGNVPVADALDAAGAGLPADSRAGVDDIAVLVQPGGSAAPAAAASAPLDPYSDPDFRRPSRPHHGSTSSLKDALLQRSEAKARTDLLREMRQQRNRSQYDCEAVARAEQYLKAGLDVWGFAAWETKYFPVATYGGATLPECRGIKKVIDPTRLDLQSTLAQGNQH